MLIEAAAASQNATLDLVSLFFFFLSSITALWQGLVTQEAVKLEVCGTF